MSNPTWNPLTPEESAVIEHAGTEAPFSGEYNVHDGNGVYTCRRCNAVLYRSLDKFQSRCGWPSFDDELPASVKRVNDPDGRRVEIRCASCDGHLGHVFTGEQHTDKDTRHCVNSLSIRFQSIESLLAQTTADTRYQALVVAGGCFWGVEYFFEREPGVLATAVGYTGGTLEHPTYEQVKTGQTQHAEVVLVIFDSQVTSLQRLYQLFFSLHDPSQVNRQGPDIGSQYRSAIFVRSPEQEHVARDTITALRQKGIQVATTIEPFTHFWMAERYHQHYCTRQGHAPTCHFIRT